LSMTKPSFSNMDMVKDGFTSQEGMFRAKTDTYFANSRYHLVFRFYIVI
jgi:hypothetical protein